MRYCTLFSFLFLLLANISAVAQQTVFKYTFPEKLPSAYNISVDDVIKKINADKFSGLDKQQQMLFAETIAYHKKQMFDRGSVYIGWDELENYLNQIVSTIIPASLKDATTDVHVYVIRNTNINAYSAADGSIYVTIGFIASVANESAIAAMLGHELAHYINKDAPNVFLRNILNRKDPNSISYFQKQYLLRNLEYSREQELEADRMGYEWASNAGYNTDGAILNFQMFSKVERLNSGILGGLVINNSADDKYNTHPLTQKRIGQINEIKKTDINKNWAPITENTALFNQLQKQAREECFNVCLEKLETESVIQNAFSSFLLDPENGAWSYFLAEGIRKHIALHNINPYSPFLDYLLYLHNDKKITNHLFSLNPDPAFLKGVSKVALSLISKDSLHSYKDYFDFFSKRAADMGFHEALFSEALYNYKNTRLRDSLLNQYITDKGASDLAYATAILNNTVYTQTTASSIIVFESFTTYKKYKSRTYIDYSKNNQLYKKYGNLLTGLLKQDFPTTFLPQFDSSYTFTFNENIQLHQLSNVLYLIANNSFSGNNPDVLLLYPDAWSLFNSKKINSVHFIDLSTSTNRYHQKLAAASVLLYSTVFPILFLRNCLKGSFINDYKVSDEYLNFSAPVSNKFYTANVNYKLRPPHFLNTFYYLLKENEK